MRSDLLAVLVRGGRSAGETISLAEPEGDAVPTCVGDDAGRGDVSEARGSGSGGVGSEAAEAVEAPSVDAEEPGTTPPGTAPSPRACCGGASTGGGRLAVGEEVEEEAAEEVAADGGGGGERIARPAEATGTHNPAPITAPGLGGTHMPGVVTGTHKPLAAARGVVTGAEAAAEEGVVTGAVAAAEEGAVTGAVAAAEEGAVTGAEAAAEEGAVTGAEAAAEEGASDCTSFASDCTSFASDCTSFASDCTSACASPQSSSASSASSAASARSVPIEEDVAKDEEVDGNTREGCRMARSEPRAPSPARSELKEKTRRMPRAGTLVCRRKPPADGASSAGASAAAVAFTAVAFTASRIVLREARSESSGSSSSLIWTRVVAEVVAKARDVLDDTSGAPPFQRSSCARTKGGRSRGGGQGRTRSGG